ncbi:hypothetical protein DW672_01895 [[Ruminococcus] lactaris]|uniref:Uncharacterized protein n=1 Tax=[Ruminococcus] lactaris TaxID=46228 RepID=A0A414P9H6_9FIRM|nr:hypothetical protein DW672_01895 [[Ruminococcus] lactaris]
MPRLRQKKKLKRKPLPKKLPKKKPLPKKLPKKRPLKRQLKRKLLPKKLPKKRPLKRRLKKRNHNNRVRQISVELYTGLLTEKFITQLLTVRV